MMQSGTLSSNGQGGFNLISGKTPQTVQPTAPAPLQSNGQGGFIIPNNAPMGVGGGNGMTPVPNSSGNGGGAVTPPAPVNPGSNGTATGVSLTVYNKDGTTSTFNTGTPGDAAKAQAALAAGGSLTDPNAQNGGTPNGSQPGQNPLISGLVTAASQPTPAFTEAQNDYNQAEEELQASKMNQSGQSFENLNNPIPSFAKGGRENSVNSAAAFQQTAEANTMNAAANEQGIQTGQQGTELTGLSNAAGYAQPSPYGPAQAPYSSYTGTGNATVSPFSGGNALGSVALGQQYTSTLLPAYSAAGAIKDDMQSFLADNPQINPDTLRVGNQLQQWVQGQMSDPKLAAFNQKLNEFLSTATPLVGAMGGMTNFKQSMVNSMLDGMAQGQTVSQAMDTMYTLMGEKLNAIKESGGQTGASSSGSSGNIFGSFSGGE
jgi:hypothetical protein